MTDNQSELASNFRQMLVELMAEQNLSGRQLGLRAGVADTTINRILSRKMVPTLDLVDRIMRALGYDVTLEAERVWGER